MTKGITDVLAINTINSNVMDVIDNWKTNALLVTPGDTYKKVLDGFYDHINQNISEKFHNIRTVYDLLAKHI